MIWKSLFTREYPLYIIDMACHVYGKQMQREIGWGYRDSLFISKKGLETAYYSNRDAESFSEFCQNKPEAFFLKVCSLIRERSRLLLGAAKKIEKMGDQERTQVFKLIHRAYSNLYSVYRFTSMVDLESAGVSSALLREFARTKDISGKAITYADRVALPKLAKIIARQNGINPRFSLYLTTSEIANGLANRKPGVSVNTLEQRYDHYVYEMKNRRIKIYTGAKARFRVKQLKIQTHSDSYRGLMKGQAGFLGVAKGKARVVKNLKDLKKLRAKEILITPMTTLQYTPYLSRVAGIVTDEGGITCHAAIISRELKKPCLIGTKIATKVFKDGDLIEVNANHGWVRKLE